MCRILITYKAEEGPPEGRSPLNRTLANLLPESWGHFRPPKGPGCSSPASSSRARCRSQVVPESSVTVPQESSILAKLCVDEGFDAIGLDYGWSPRWSRLQSLTTPLLELCHHHGYVPRAGRAAKDDVDHLRGRQPKYSWSSASTSCFPCRPGPGGNAVVRALGSQPQTWLTCPLCTAKHRFDSGSLRPTYIFSTNQLWWVENLVGRCKFRQTNHEEKG